MKARPKHALIALGLLVALSAILSGPAAAHKKGYASSITIREEGSGSVYKGRVRSDKAGCVANRKAKLYRSTGEYIGSDTTDQKGRWELNFVGDNYYAKVTRKVMSRNGHRHICRDARSKTTY